MRAESLKGHLDGYGLTAPDARAQADSRATWREISTAVSASLLDRACAPTT